MTTAQSKSFSLPTKLIWLLGFVILAIFLSAFVLPKKAFAANEEGYGWAIPGDNSNSSGVSCGGNLRTSVWVFVKDITNNNTVPAGIRMRNVANGNTVTTLGTNLRIDCIDVNQGLWLSVWGLSGYQRWDNAVNFIGLTERFNYCCGFKSLDTSADNGKLVIYSIYVVPSGVTVTANSSLGTALPGTIYSTATGNYDVPLNFHTSPAMPNSTTCGGGSQRINRFIWLRNVSTGTQILGPGGTLGDGNVDGFGFINPPGALNSQENYTVNLPVGQYQWYGQYQENSRRCGNLNNSIPISGQTPWQFFEVRAALPDLIVENLSFSPGAPAAGDSMSFSGNIRNAGAAAAVASQTRLRIDIGRNGTWDILPGNSATGALGVGASETENWSNVWVAFAGNHRFEICADITNTNAESNEGNNCTTRDFTVAVVAVPRPDLIVSGPSVSGPMVINQPIGFQGTIRNTGPASTVVSSYSRLRIDLGRDGSWDITLSPDQVSAVLAGTSPGPAGSEPEVWGWTPISGQEGNHYFEICADTSNNAANNNLVTESNEANNCTAPQPFSVSSASAWLRTRDGNVGSKSSIGFNYPNPNNCPANPGQCNASYVIQAATINEAVFKSAKNWLVRNSPSIGKFNDYQKLYREFSGGNPCLLTGANTLPSNKGKFVRNGNLDYTTDAAIGCFSTASKDARVIFVNGDLTISKNINSGLPLVFIVSGNIVIRPTVTEVNAVLIANRSVGDTPAASSQLKVKGSVVGVLSDISGDGVLLYRDLGNNCALAVCNQNDPAEELTFQPKYLYLLTEYLGVFVSTYREVNP